MFVWNKNCLWTSSCPLSGAPSPRPRLYSTCWDRSSGRPSQQHSETRSAHLRPQICQPRRDISPHQDSAGTARSSEQLPAQPSPPPQTRGKPSHSGLTPAWSGTPPLAQPPPPWTRAPLLCSRRCTGVKLRFGFLCRRSATESPMARRLYRDYSHEHRLNGAWIYIYNDDLTRVNLSPGSPDTPKLQCKL